MKTRSAWQDQLDDLEIEYEEVRSNLAGAVSYETKLRRAHSEAKRKGIADACEQLRKDLDRQQEVVHDLREYRNQLGMKISNFPKLMRALLLSKKGNSQLQLPGVV
jgi:chromosome segregation ATPase